MSGLKVMHPLNRRQFLAGCAGSGLAARMAAAPAGIDMAQMMPTDKAKVRLVFTHPEPERQGWPYQHYDYERRKKKYLKLFAERCPEVNFLSVTVKSDEQAQTLLEEGGVDGYLVYMLGIPSNGNRVIAHSGEPTILVDDLYGGTGRFLGVYGPALAKGMPVAGISSSNFDDVAEAANTFSAIKRFQASVLLDVTERNIDERIALYKDTLGADIHQVNVEEFNKAYENADAGEAAAWAKRWDLWRLYRSGASGARAAALWCHVRRYAGTSSEAPGARHRCRLPAALLRQQDGGISVLGVLPVEQ